MALLASLFESLKATGQRRLKELQTCLQVVYSHKISVPSAQQICLHKCDTTQLRVPPRKHNMFCLPLLGQFPLLVMLQAKRRRSAAQAHPRRSSATPKRAELMEEDAGPATAALPAQQVANDAQQDEMRMEPSQGKATAGSPAEGRMATRLGSGQQTDGHEREAPKSLASRISRFAGIFTGHKNTFDTPTGQCSAFTGACVDYLCKCNDTKAIIDKFVSIL